MIRYAKVIFLLTISLLLLYSCKKDKVDADVKKDNISYTAVNKTVIVGEIDTVLFGVCHSLVCSVDTTIKDKAKQVRFYQLSYDGCIGGGYLMISSGLDTNHRFLRNDIIDSNANWFGNEIFVDSLAGKGEIFIGFDDIMYPEGTDEHYYGWIRIELSANKQELKIVDRAKNLTEGNPIRAGQVN